MSLPNFNIIDPSIAWEKSLVTKPETISSERFTKYLKEHKFLLIPPIISLLPIIIIVISNLYVQSSIRELAPDHDQYSMLQLKFSRLTKKSAKLSDELKQIEEYLLNSIHVPAFARLLQERIPLDVQLMDYSLTNNNISVSATSHSQQSINDFVIFFSSHPLIQQNSITIVELISASPSTQNSADRATQQPRQFFTVKLSGAYKNMGSNRLLTTLLNTGNIGLYDKLSKISTSSK